MNKEEYDKYKKVVDELDGYDICDEFNLVTYELKDKKKLLEIVLMYYFKNQDELEEKDNEIERLNNIINELEKWLKYWLEVNKGAMECPLSSSTEDMEMRIENKLYEDALNKLKELKEGK